MFEPLKPSHRSTRAQITSFAVHAVVVYLLVMPTIALFVAPYSVQFGHGGTSTALIFTGRNTAEVEQSEDAPPTSQKLAYIPEAKPVPQHMKVKARKTKNKATTTLADAARAGVPYGSVMDGALTGHDVRPAFPIQYPDPAIARSEIPSGVAGTVIIEVTIDTLGHVTATKILQRLGHGIDEKVEAAVRNWVYHPAFMDGRPIPSQQDVLYRYPS